MYEIVSNPETNHFLKSLGFPSLRVHHAFNHFDFRRAPRRILVIGPMGSGKTEYSSRIWRDARVARGKSDAVQALTASGRADRRRVFFVRSLLDGGRFSEYPDDALAYRGGFERCGDAIAQIADSFELERKLEENPEVGTWIIDEASFYDERLAYVVRNASERSDLIFVFPTLILNFRKEIFNSTARLLLETCTDVFPLTAYCEHPDCIEDSFYTYRYYVVDGVECPALYFDPLVIIGGDREKTDPREPNYCTRCDRHHYLPGKEYAYLILKPLGEQASQGRLEPLRTELSHLRFSPESSQLYRHFQKRFGNGAVFDEANMNALRVPCLAERAAVYLYTEQNLLSAEQLRRLVEDLELDREYLRQRLRDSRRSLEL